MIGFIPVADQNREIAVGIGKRDRNSGPAENSDPAKSAGSFVESERWEIVEAADLILHLQSVGEVLARRNWTRGSVHSIFE